MAAIPENDREGEHETIKNEEADEDQVDYNTECCEDADKGHTQYLSLLIFTLFFYVGTMGAYFLLPQYLLHRFKVEANLTNINSSSPCTVNKSDPAYEEEQKVQAKSSAVLGAVTLASGIPCILTVFLFGAMSDKYGRRLVIIINFFGLLLSNLMLTFIVSFDLSMYIYIIFAFFNGMTGSYSALLASVFAYTADVTTKQQRNIGIGVMEGSLGLSMVVASLVVGFWIKLGGFSTPMIGLTILTGISGLFLFCVKETRHRTRIDSTGGGKCRILLAAIRLQLNSIKYLLVLRKRRSACVLLLAGSFFFHAFVNIGTILITTLYLMNQPFCWDYATYGIFSAVKSTVWNVGSMVMIVLLRNRVPDVLLIMISFLSFIICFVLFGIASLFPPPMCNILVIVGAGTGFMISVSPILLRSTASKLVSVDEQGAVFGLIATGEALATAIGPATMSAVYSGSVVFLKGFVFFVGCAGIGLALLLMAIYRVVARPWVHYVEMDVSTN